MCCNKIDCNCNKKGCGCNKAIKYCGSYLPCSGIENGDSLEDIVVKLDAIACEATNDSDDCNNCNAFYISKHSIKGDNNSDEITFEIEGGSGDYTFYFQETRISPSAEEALISESSGVIIVGNILYDEPAIEIFFLITVKDNKTGCVAQYPFYLKTSRIGG